MSGYHSPHLPADQPGGFDGAWATCLTSVAFIRPCSHSSTSGLTKTALRPARVTVRRTSYSRISARRPEPQRAKALRHLRATVRRRPWEVRRTRRVGQKLRVVHPLGRARELELKPNRREGDDLIGAFVVVEVVVVVLQEKHRRRPEIRAVYRNDLRGGRELEHRLVLVAEHERRSIEAVEPGRVSAVRRRARRVQIPVHVIAVGDRRIRPKRQRAAQETIPDGRRQMTAREAIALRSAGAGEKSTRKRSGVASRDGNVESSHGSQSNAPSAAASESV